MRVCGISVNGGLAGYGVTAMSSNEDAKSLESVENSRNNSWNVNFTSGNVNNWNNKYNNGYVRPCSAYADFKAFLDSMRLAYSDCLKGKRSSAQALEYMPIATADIPKLAWEVWTRAYEPSPSTCFMVTFPKLREVFAAAFRDRIIHHWIAIRMIPLFEERCHELGDVSHACRKGYGTKTAVEQVQKGMLRVSDHLQREAWVYKGDIVGFFMNINKRILLGELHSLIVNRYKGTDIDILLYLVEKTVFHCPQKSCCIRSPVDMWKIIRRDKSLFFADDNKGGPIGNLTAQLFAGYYMSFLDEYVEDMFKGKTYSYTRSVDDFVIICTDRVFLRHAIRQIADFTSAQMDIECHSDNIYFQPVSHGVKFLGQYIYPHRRYTINRTIGRFISKANWCLRECGKDMTEIRREYWGQVFNSYFGFLTQTNEYNTRNKIFKMLTHEWYQHFSITNKRKVTVKHRRLWNKNNNNRKCTSSTRTATASGRTTTMR